MLKAQITNNKMNLHPLHPILQKRKKKLGVLLHLLMCSVKMCAKILFNVEIEETK